MSRLPDTPRRVAAASVLGLALALALALPGCAQLDGLLQLPAADVVPSADIQAALAEVDRGYVIGAEDVLDIQVWRDDTLRSSALVRPDGGISFPLVGDVSVAGRTAEQVRDELTLRLDKFLPEPVVSVSVARVASQRIYVLGRVNKPGDYAVGRPVDVLQALTLAGGMTPFAVEDGIRVIRRVNGRSVAIPFQYSRVRRDNDLSQNITLRSGDVLLVP